MGFGVWGLGFHVDLALISPPRSQLIFPEPPPSPEPMEEKPNKVPGPGVLIVEGFCFLIEFRDPDSLLTRGGGKGGVYKYEVNVRV